MKAKTRQYRFESRAFLLSGSQPWPGIRTEFVLSPAHRWMVSFSLPSKDIAAVRRHADGCFLVTFCFEGPEIVCENALLHSAAIWNATVFCQFGRSDQVGLHRSWQSDVLQGVVVIGFTNIFQISCDYWRLFTRIAPEFALLASLKQDSQHNSCCPSFLRWRFGRTQMEPSAKT